ncbi:MAG: hypothetical protein IKA36_00680 [Clostridia bacterium]|nr:hypothetical protein [Clostridia bacterium]
MEKLSKAFLENFNMPINYNSVIKDLSRISKRNFKLSKCKFNLKITFDESNLFGKSASIKDNHISFNKTRLDILCEKRIDCHDKNHLSNMYDFYKSFNDTKCSDHEKCLYEFMNKYIQNGYAKYFTKIGSFRTIKYELLETIFHENEHVFQKQYTEYFDNISKCPKDAKTLFLVFTMLFNTIYEFLVKNKIKFDYKVENYIFPIEFDARYESMTKLNQVKEKYFATDKLFSQYIINSSLLPYNFDKTKTALQIFADYENLYKLYCKNTTTNNYHDIHIFICSVKNIIIDEIIRRYEEMQDIVEKNKC